MPLGKNYGYYAERQGYYPSSNNINLKRNDNISEVTENITLTSIREMKEEKARVRINNIFFDFDKYELKPESYPELDRLAEFIKKNKPYLVRIEGHTDNSGTLEYNMNLSKLRAQSVLNYLLNNGLNKELLVAIGFGMLNPIADNNSEENKAKNRRVEIWFDN